MNKNFIYCSVLSLILYYSENKIYFCHANQIRHSKNMIAPKHSHALNISQLQSKILNISKDNCVSDIYLTMEGVVTLSMCASLCLADLDCVSITYHQKPNQCHFSGLEALVPCGGELGDLDGTVTLLFYTGK